jgi:hypothetical protein
MIEPNTFFHLVVPAWLIIGSALCMTLWKMTRTLSKGKALLLRTLSISIIFASFPFSPDHQGYQTVLMPLWAIEPLFKLNPDYSGVMLYFAGFSVVTGLMVYLSSLTWRFISPEVRY